ncbi:MAG: type II toxin-antitoxin system Phd/YefM family antitoxin [Lachnospiraceae bacterium]|nr:type II toxin-antitoxin system Phd/YefM family antitoxin [Lachnospiraceae bacterium]
MTAIKGTTIKTEFKRICELANKGETFIITRPGNENVVILSEKEYQQLIRAKAYAERLSGLVSAGTSAEDTYPEGFFELFGSGKALGLDESPEELSFSNDVKREVL